MRNTSLQMRPRTGDKSTLSKGMTAFPLFDSPGALPEPRIGKMEVEKEEAQSTANFNHYDHAHATDAQHVAGAGPIQLAGHTHLGWKSVRNTLKKKISVLFRKKGQTIAAWKTATTDDQTTSLDSSQVTSISQETCTALGDVQGHPKDAYLGATRRNGLDLPREPASMTTCAFHEAVASDHCMPSCRDATTLTQFPPLPEDHSVVRYDDSEPFGLDANETAANDVSIHDIIKRSSGHPQHKSIFDLFPNQS